MFSVIFKIKEQLKGKLLLTRHNKGIFQFVLQILKFL